MIIDPIWILCNPRTGSSYLCECLNHTGYFEPYENEYTDKRGDDRMLEHGMAFCEWMRIIKNKESFERNPPKFLKNIYEQPIS